MSASGTNHTVRTAATVTTGTFVWSGPTPEELAEAERREEERRRQAAAEAARQRKEDRLERVKAEKAQQRLIVSRLPKGKVIGSVTMPKRCVEIMVRDHGGVDGDRIKLKLNNKVIVRNLTLTDSWKSYRRRVPRGPSYVIAKALNEGDNSPNTAELAIRPCNGTQRVYQWKMKTGERRSVKLDRR